jgi:hypothetical protein
MSSEPFGHFTRRLIGGGKTGRMCIVSGLVAGVAALTQFAPNQAQAPDRALYAGLDAAAILLLALGAALLAFRERSPEPTRGLVALARAEQAQNRRQMAYLLIPVSLALQLIGTLRAARHAGEGLILTRIEFFEVACFLAFLLLFAAMIGGRVLDRWACPAIDDELAQAFRAQAMKLGYVLLLPGLALLVIIGLFRSALALELAPLVAAIGVAGPALRLFMLERAAGRDAEA